MSPADRSVLLPRFCKVCLRLLACLRSSADVVHLQRNSRANLRPSVACVEDATSADFTVSVAADPFALERGGACAQPRQDGFGMMQFIECPIGMLFCVTEPL